MNIIVLEALFEAGVLAQVEIAPVPLKKSWVLTVQKYDGSSIILSNAKGLEKHFKGVNAAMTAARRIGFSEVRTLLPEMNIPITR